MPALLYSIHPSKWLLCWKREKDERKGGRVGAKEEERQRGGLRDGGREEGWKMGRN